MAEGDKPRKIVLLVDDDVMHLSLTRLALKDKYGVYAAKSGEEALDFLDKNHIVPDLILLDIMMPVMDGWVVFDKISNIASLKFTPIMFYTSLDEESTVERAYELGIFDYITKPCEQSILLEKVENALEKAESHKQRYGS